MFNISDSSSLRASSVAAEFILGRKVRMHYATIIGILFLLADCINISVSIKGSNYAVLRGSTIRISCVPKNVQVEGESDVASSYAWLGDDGKEVIDARFTKLASGELEITNAHIADSGIYTCKFRPPTAWNAKNEKEKTFRHKLLVYEIASHTFHSIAFFDLSVRTAEDTASVLHDLLKSRVCGNELCVPGTIKPKKCALLETGKQTCEFLMSYKSIEPLPDEQCNEECLGEIMADGLKKAETLLKSALMAELENPRALLKPDMKTFETKHLITCRPGYRLFKTHHKRCFPCFPGSYSKHNSLKCRMCAVGFYQEHYGRHECEKCEEGNTTDSVGAKSKAECVLTNPGFLNNIQKGIQSIFTG